jgi:hypothetical protein
MNATAACLTRIKALSAAVNYSCQTFDRIEALQGQQNTFYAGSLLPFETVEDAVAYSKKLVERFF